MLMAVNSNKKLADSFHSRQNLCTYGLAQHHTMTITQHMHTDSAAQNDLVNVNTEQ